MKNHIEIPAPLLFGPVAVRLRGLPRQDAAGRQDGRGCFHPFQRNGTTYQPSLFLRARRRPAAGAYPLFQRLGARRRVRRFVGRERLVEQVQRRRLGTRCGTLLEMQRHDRRRSLPHFLALRSIKTSAVQTSFSKVSRNTTRPTRRYTPERCRSVSARSISCAPTCTTAC